MTKPQQQALAAFANMGVASSKYEVFGHGAPADIDATLMALCGAGLLVALPTTEQFDKHGGTRFRVTTEGWKAIGRGPYPPVKSHGVRVVSDNPVRA